MQAEKNSTTQIELPAMLAERFRDAASFEVTEQNGGLLLTPIYKSRVDAICERLDSLNLSDHDVEDAIRWARTEG